MKSAKWILAVTALSAAVATTTTACTKAAESRDRAPTQQEPAPPPQAAAEPAAEAAAVEPAAEPVPEAAEAAAEAAVVDMPVGAEAAAPAAAAGPKVFTSASRNSGNSGSATALSNVTVTKQYYTLEIKVPPAVASGKPAEVVVTLVPKNGRHLNHEFPTKLTITPPAGVTVAKPTLKKTDAETFNDNLATFKVSFTSSDAGEKAFAGKFKFAVCTDTTCDPQTEQLAFKVSVK